jgi:uncharacterized protein (DUF697 family)
VNILSLYEKLEKLAERLPSQLQHPILREIGPIKTLFLQQRAPRILLMGDRARSRSELVNALFGQHVAETGEDHLQDRTWQVFASSRGKLRLLDGRRPVGAALVRRALAAEPADLCIYLHAGASAAEDLQRMQEVLDGSDPIPVFGVATGLASADAEESRHALHATLERAEGKQFTGEVAGVFVPTLGKQEIHKFAASLAAELPHEAKLEMARLSGVRELQLEIAGALVKSTAAICGAVGTQPIPLADFPILTALQAFMVAGIMHISGRELNAKLAAEWMAAVGANIGLGLVLREGSRAVLKFVPIWGDLVSGGIAAAGTYAVGKAATAYFIEGVSLPDARALFRKGKKAPKQLK